MILWCAYLLWTVKLAPQSFNLIPDGTPFHMVIYHPHSLHKCVGGCRTEKLPATFFQIFTKRLGSFRDAWNRVCVVTLSSVGLSGIGLPLTNIGSEAPKLMDDLKRPTSIVYGRLDFSSVTDNAISPEKPSDVPDAKTSDLVELKTRERFPEVFTLAKNGQPGESRLEALQADLFEESEIVGDRASAGGGDAPQLLDELRKQLASFQHEGLCEPDAQRVEAWLEGIHRLVNREGTEATP